VTLKALSPWQVEEMERAGMLRLVRLAAQCVGDADRQANAMALVACRSAVEYGDDSVLDGLRALLLKRYPVSLPSTHLYAYSSSYPYPYRYFSHPSPSSSPYCLHHRHHVQRWLEEGCFFLTLRSWFALVSQTNDTDSGDDLEKRVDGMEAMLNWDQDLVEQPPHHHSSNCPHSP